MSLMMTSAQVVETSFSVTRNSPPQDYTHPDNHSLPTCSVIFPGVLPALEPPNVFYSIYFPERFLSHQPVLAWFVT